MQFKKNFLALISSIVGEQVTARSITLRQVFTTERTRYSSALPVVRWGVEIKSKGRTSLVALPKQATLGFVDYGQRELIERAAEAFKVERLPFISPHLLDKHSGDKPAMERLATVIQLCQKSEFARQLYAETEHEADRHGVTAITIRLMRLHARAIQQHGRSELSATIEATAAAYAAEINAPRRQYNKAMRAAAEGRHRAVFGVIDPETIGAALALLYSKKGAAQWERRIRGLDEYSGRNNAAYAGKDPLEVWALFHKLHPSQPETPRSRRKPPTTTRAGAAARRDEVLNFVVLSKSARLAGYWIDQGINADNHNWKRPERGFLEGGRTALFEAAQRRLVEELGN